MVGERNGTEKNYARGNFRNRWKTKCFEGMKHGKGKERKEMNVSWELLVIKPNKKDGNREYW